MSQQRMLVYLSLVLKFILQLVILVRNDSFAYIVSIILTKRRITLFEVIFFCATTFKSSGARIAVASTIVESARDGTYFFFKLFNIVAVIILLRVRRFFTNQKFLIYTNI